MASSHVLLLNQHMFFLKTKPPPSSSSSSSLLIRRPLLSAAALGLLYKPRNPVFSLCNSYSSSYPQPPSASLLLQQQQQQQQQPPIVDDVKTSSVELPNLSIKEKKELASYAHSLGKKLKTQQVGKSGVTDSVAASFVENLESNELLKLKIHNNCPGELPDVIKQLEVTTGSVAVGQIGRTVILYRPSLSKLEAEEKKRQARGVFVRKGYRPRPTEFRVKSAEFRSKPDESMEKRGAAPPRLSGRGRRGTSRNELS